MIRGPIDPRGPEQGPRGSSAGPGQHGGAVGFGRAGPPFVFRGGWLDVTSNGGDRP